MTQAQGWFVEQRLRLGRYDNISEVVHDGLRRLGAVPNLPLRDARAP